MKQKEPVECKPGDIQFFGLRRGGHHAVINWFQLHYKKCDYFTDCFLRENNKVENWPGHRFVYHNPKGKGEVRFLSFEDKLREPNPPFSAYSQLPHTKRFLIVRDAFNCFASRLQRHRHPDYPNWKQWDTRLDVSLWLTFLKEYLGETNDLGAVPINYNFWCNDATYREKLALEHIGHFTDEGRKVVAVIGGSSFDGLNYQGKAEQMSVADRWQQFTTDSEYAPLLENKELVELCKLHFGLML